MSTYLEQYRDAIRRGEIIAGQELISVLDMVNIEKPMLFLYNNSVE